MTPTRASAGGLALAALAAGAFAALAALAAPLRPQGADTVGGRLGAVSLACAGTLDLSGVGWIQRAARQGQLPYYLTTGPGDRIVSIYGPAPALLGRLAMTGLAPGARVDDRELQRRARLAAAGALALATALLALALGSELTPLRALAWALVAAGSFAGAATLGQALWQQTAALPVLTLALAALAWGRRRPGLIALVPGLALAAAVLRPPAAAGLAGLVVAALGLQWRSAGGRRMLGRTVVVALLATAPLLASNWLDFGSPAPHGQAAAVTELAGAGPVWSLAPLPFAARLLALVASPFRGLLFFAPMVLAGTAVGLARRDLVSRALAAGMLAQILLIAAYYYWWGGVCFGPRLLAELVWIAPLALAAGRGAPTPAAPHRGAGPLPRTLVAFAALATVAIGTVGLLAYDPRAFELRRDPRRDPAAIWDLADNPLSALWSARPLGPQILDAPPGPFVYCAPVPLADAPLQIR